MLLDPEERQIVMAFLVGIVLGLLLASTSVVAYLVAAPL